MGHSGFYPEEDEVRFLNKEKSHPLKPGGFLFGRATMKALIVVDHFIADKAKNSAGTRSSGFRMRAVLFINALAKID